MSPSRPGGWLPEPDPAADAVLVFSSGTAGMPKAVRPTQGAVYFGGNRRAPSRRMTSPLR
jgi:acyl-coenzyme A synthetase/AMP-(fatty) acid ligase